MSGRWRSVGKWEIAAARETTLWNFGAACFDQQRYNVALACYLLAKEIYKQVQSPSADSVERWIAKLRDRIGEQQFAALLAQVEHHEEQIVEDALREIRQQPSFEDQRPQVRDEDEKADHDGEHGAQQHGSG